MSGVMPPEWSPHRATWMAFPVAAYPGAGVSHDDVWAAWADVANTIADHEPVRVLCNPAQHRLATRLLSSDIELHEAVFNDAWLRDTGPTFTVNDGQLVAVDWAFNGWGDHTTFAWEPDDRLAAGIASLLEVETCRSPLVNEGGGFHVDGNGRVLLTESVQLDPDRNPDWSKTKVAGEIHQRLGTDQAVWLPHGLWRDYQDHGTRGHVDMVACFASSGQVILHRQMDPGHPDAGRYQEHRAALEAGGLDIVELPAPRTLRDNKDWVDYSYINHYVINGAVVMPVFADRNDDQAAEILESLWPGREIRRVDARVIFAMGGGVHCITQQQPET